MSFIGTVAVFEDAYVRFVESPRVEAYGTVAVFEDLYGNRWDLVQMNAAYSPISGYIPRFGD